MFGKAGRKSPGEPKDSVGLLDDLILGEFGSFPLVELRKSFYF